MNNRNAFTLLEMSIVLVIIGLVIGSITVGQAMIRAAQMRDVVSEYDGYLKAIKEFQDKYLALPGDMNNAESIWGSDASCPNTAPNTIPKTATCNGDGNGHIGDSLVSGSPSTNTTEWFRAWQQLSDAGMIQNQFTGARVKGGVASNESHPGINIPASALNSAGWTLIYYLNTSGNVGLWSDQYGHLLALGALTTASYTATPILTPAEALGFDQKLDDGMPGTGKIRAWRTSVLANCTINDTSQTGQTYNTNSDQQCSLVFLLGF